MSVEVCSKQWHLRSSPLSDACYLAPTMAYDNTTATNNNAIMSNMDKEFGQYNDDDDDDNDNGTITSSPLVTSSSSYSPPKSLLYYLATLQAFLIIYRTEVLLSSILAISLSIALHSILPHNNNNYHRGNDPFLSAKITNDYSSLTSKYDLTLGSINHWCLQNDNDNSCSCEDPLEPMGKHSSHKWAEQHLENVKVATAALIKSGNGGLADYQPGVNDDMWIENVGDDWVWGKGARFGDDDVGMGMGWGDSVGGGDDGGGDYDDGFGVPMEVGTSGTDGGEDGDVMELQENNGIRLLSENWELDVVFVGDSITEQRQGTSMGRDNGDYVGIQEVFEKTFTKEKGGEFNGIAMGISGDTSPNLLWRLMNGEMPYGLNPKVWWVGIGINDLSMKGCSEEVVLLGILRVVEEIESSHPNAYIVINSLLPVRRNEDGLLEHAMKNKKHMALKQKENNLQESEMNPKRIHVDLWPSIVAINEELSKFASKHSRIKFFSANDVFVEEREDGKHLKLELMEDMVHPNLSGHKKWNGAIKKKLHQILEGKE